MRIKCIMCGVCVPFAVHMCFFSDLNCVQSEQLRCGCVKTLNMHCSILFIDYWNGSGPIGLSWELILLLLLLLLYTTTTTTLCRMTCSTVQDDLFHCAGWLVPLCRMTYSTVQEDLFHCAGRLIPLCRIYIARRNTRYSKTNYMSNQINQNK